MEVFSVHVDIVQPDCGIIKLGPKSLKVPEVYGLSEPLDGNVVAFHYEKTSSLQCSVLLTSEDTHFPAKGQLVTGEPEEATKRGDEPESIVPLRQQRGDLSLWSQCWTSSTCWSRLLRVQDLCMSCRSPKLGRVSPRRLPEGPEACQVLRGPL